MTAPRRVAVSITNFNGRATLPPTLASVFAQDYAHITEVMLADDGSTDESIAFVQAQFPMVRILRGPRNRGPNSVRNMGLVATTAELVLVMDNDIVLQPDYVARTVAAFAAEPEAGAVSGQIRFHDQPERVQYQGGVDIHYAGAAVQVQPAGRERMQAGAVSAGAMLVDRAKAARVGGFDEDFRFGWEDGDFTFRLALAGFANFVVPGAVCFHLKQKRGTRWLRYQIRNRWWFMLKNFDGRTLLLAAPAILFYQGCVALWCLLKLKPLDFVRGSLMVVGTLPLILRKRRVVMALKTVHDGRLLTGRAIDTLGDAGASGVVRVANGISNAVLGGYWRLIRGLLRR